MLLDSKGLYKSLGAPLCPWDDTLRGELELGSVPRVLSFSRTLASFARRRSWQIKYHKPIISYENCHWKLFVMIFLGFLKQTDVLIKLITVRKNRKTGKPQCFLREFGKRVEYNDSFFGVNCMKRYNHPALAKFQF